ncbi:MAG: hypothetical protein J5666_05220 [Bacilli bacterium]|nr:hypothetical protein [Bacilli bacterium]
MALLRSNNKQKIINGLLNASLDDETIDRLTSLQNEIGVSFSTKVIAITSINDDALAVAFAKAFASAYSVNNERTLIIDANLYNPSLRKTLKESDGERSGGYKVTFVDGKPNAVCLSKETYPSEVLKGGIVQKIINENQGNYDHFVVLVPSIKEHKEIVLLKDVLTAIVLVAQKDVTKKEHIFNAIQYCAANNLPLAKTVVLK